MGCSECQYPHSHEDLEVAYDRERGKSLVGGGVLEEASQGRAGASSSIKWIVLSVQKVYHMCGIDQELWPSSFAQFCVFRHIMYDLIP